MRKIYLTTVFMTFAAGWLMNAAMAQCFGGLSFGYGIPKGTMNINGFSNSTVVDANTYTDKQIYLSLGKGFNFGLTGGHMCNKNFGGQLDVNFLAGGKTTAKDSSPSGTEKYTLQANMLRIIPAAIVKAGFTGLDPYARFGAVISMGRVKYTGEQNYSSYVTEDIWNYKSGVALGFMGALGAEYPISDKLDVFGEINTINQTYSPKKGELTKSTYNGEDQLGSMTTSQKEVKFENEVTYDYEGGQQPPPDEPTKVLKTKYPLGSVGFLFGVHYNLKKREATR